MNVLKKLNKWLKEKAATLQMIICIIWAAMAIALLFIEIVDPDILNGEKHLILLAPWPVLYIIINYFLINYFTETIKTTYDAYDGAMGMTHLYQQLLTYTITGNSNFTFEDYCDKFFKDGNAKAYVISYKQYLNALEEYKSGINLNYTILPWAVVNENYKIENKYIYVNEAHNYKNDPVLDRILKS